MNRCLGLFEGGVPCKNNKHPNRGDYCNSCWKNGRKPPCQGYNLITDEPCPYKAKERGYCGCHKNFGVTYEMETLKIEIRVYSKEEYELLETNRKHIREQKELAYNYRNHLLQRDLSKKEKSLLIMKFPECIEEWDYIENEGVNICEISHGTDSKYSWICPINSEHPPYDQMVNYHAKSRKCKECRLESIGRGKEVREKEMKYMRERVVDPKNDYTSIGDETEVFVTKILNDMNIYQSVTKLGEVSGDSDIEIIDKNGKINYIQVKTLTEYEERFTLTMRDYPENMLIVGVDKGRKYFFLEFAGTFDVTCISLSFLSDKAKYKNYMYYDLESFKKKLVEYIPLSAQENILYKTNEKEYNSFKRLLQECNKRGLFFKRNTTNGNTIDGYINNFKIQGKYRTKNTSYCININKNCGNFNGRKLKSAYEEHDFHYLIIELAGPDYDLEKYHGFFCIIPMEILIEKGLIRTATCDGKTDLTIHPPDSPVDHWSKQYWNNFSVFE